MICIASSAGMTQTAIFEVFGESLFPNMHVKIGTLLVPELFFPAVLLPSIVFVALYAYPFLEKLFSFESREHNVLRLPYQQPFSTAAGCGLVMFVLVLEAAGADDVIAVAMNGSVTQIRTTLRVLVVVLPAITWIVVYGMCLRALRVRAARGGTINLDG